MGCDPGRLNVEYACICVYTYTFIYYVLYMYKVVMMEIGRLILKEVYRDCFCVLFTISLSLTRGFFMNA